MPKRELDQSTEIWSAENAANFMDQLVNAKEKGVEKTQKLKKLAVKNRRNKIISIDSKEK